MLDEPAPREVSALSAASASGSDPRHDPHSDVRWQSSLRVVQSIARPSAALARQLLSRLFRRLFLEDLQKAFRAGELRFFSSLEQLRDPAALIANNRIVDIEDGKVRFRWKDYRNENRQKMRG